MRRVKKEDQISVRLDDRLRASLDAIKEKYGYSTDSDALRGLIVLIHNKNIIAAEVEGRVVTTLRPYIEEQMRECGRSEENKDLVRALVDEILHEETDEV